MQSNQSRITKHNKTSFASYVVSEILSCLTIFGHITISWKFYKTLHVRYQKTKNKIK